MACKRCGGDHFNFTKCEDATKQVVKRAPDRFFRPREGEKDFGNRLLASEVNKANPNVVYIPRKDHPLYAPPKDAA